MVGVYRAKVEYKVSVILQQNASVTNWTGRAVATTDLTVLSPQLPHSGRNPLERYAEQPVSDCCGCSVCCGDCCVRGRVGSHVGVDADYIATGGSVGTYALIWVRNFSFYKECRKHLAHLLCIRQETTARILETLHRNMKAHNIQYPP